LYFSLQVKVRDAIEQVGYEVPVALSFLAHQNFLMTSISLLRCSRAPSHNS